MPTVLDARTAVAEALSSVEGYSVRPNPFTAPPTAGDGWVEITSVRPLTGFGRSAAVDLSVPVFLGPDRAAAEARFDSDGLALVAAVAALGALSVSVAPEVATVGQSSTPVYLARLTLTVEV